MVENMTDILQNFSKSWLILKQLGNVDGQGSANISWRHSTVDDDSVYASLTQHPASGGNEESLNRVVKLLTISAISIISSIGNLFIISTILMEDHLKKRGNVFVVNAALADFVIAAIAIPSATIGWLANLNDWKIIESLQWGSMILVLFITAPSLAATAVDFQLQIAIGSDRYLGLVTITRLAITISIIWISSFIGLSSFLLFDLGPDLFHSRNNLDEFLSSEWSWPIPLTILSVQVLGPIVLAVIVHSVSAIQIRSGNVLPHPCENAGLRSNIAVCILFILCWTPPIVFLGLSVTRTYPVRLFKNLQFLAMTKSCLSPFVYVACSKNYREAFVTLFHYCCCKTSVSFSRRVRTDSVRPPSDVRVHIIPGYNVYSAVAQGSSGRSASNTTHNHNEPTAKPIARPKGAKMSKSSSSKHQSSKEVYEL